jgi:hypothetical protein
MLIKNHHKALRTTNTTRRDQPHGTMRSKHVSLLLAVLLPALLILASAQQQAGGASPSSSTSSASAPTAATTSSACPDACNARGDCIKGICVCARPFTGVACEEEGDLSASAETISAVGGFPAPPQGSSSAHDGAGSASTTTTRESAQSGEAPSSSVSSGGSSDDALRLADPARTPLTICLVTAEVVGPVSNGGGCTSCIQLTIARKRLVSGFNP